MILLVEKDKIRKTIGFDLSDPDQKLAYDILETKRGKTLSRFLAKSIIIGEMIERKKQTDSIEKRGNELLNNIDIFSDNVSTVSTPTVKEKKKKQRKVNVQEKQDIEIAQTEQKETKKEVAEEIMNPVISETEEIKTSEPENKNMVLEETPAKEMELEEDNESTDIPLDDDTLKKAMSIFNL